ncbi:MAG TPA: protease pro-enzyme activation domain-containing protein, partial [Bryobacteraceae bacterium]|nr:protease pro-enzyme activation domain-containing protein [Bryobacteraceae bacterium]
MPFENRVALRGSTRTLLPGSEQISAVDAEEPMLVTVVLRRRAPLPPPEMGRCMTRDQFNSSHGANAGDIAMVQQFAGEYGLTVAGAYAPQRRMVLSGSAANMQRAFGVSLAHYEGPEAGIRYRGREGEISIPSEMQHCIVAVLGLDNRPIAKPHIRYPQAAAATGTFTPPQVAALYGYPTGLTGSGQTVGIIELGGGYSTSDLSTYFGQLGISPTPTVSSVSVDGGINSPGSNADGEVMLDIEVIGSIANRAKIVVYFAPNTDQGFLDAITNAVHDSSNKPSVISISWGGPEDSWT